MSTHIRNKLQVRFYEPGYGTLANKTKARCLAYRAEQKRNKSSIYKNPYSLKNKKNRKEYILGAIIRVNGRRIETKTLKNPEKPKTYHKCTKFPLSTILMIFIFGIMLLLIVNSSVRINEATATHEDLQAHVASLRVDVKEMELKLESKNDLRLIENIAVNQIGMIKKEATNKIYIAITTEDSVILEDLPPEQIAHVGLLSAFYDKIDQLHEYLK